MTSEFKPSDLLRHLGRGAPHGHYWHKNIGRDGGITQWYSTAAIPRPDNLAKPHHLFFGVNPCGAIPPGDPAYVRSQNLYIGAVNCMYADIDFKNWPGGELATREYVDGLKAAETGPQPNVIIFTGGGFHVYWLLESPVIFTHIGELDTLRDHVAELQRKWVILIGGDPAAKDLARPLRVPNSLNCKPEYGEPRRVEIVYADMSSCYDLADIEVLTSQVIDAPQPEQPPKKQPAAAPLYSSSSVIELYNRNNRITDVMKYYGYTIDGDKFVRPGKNAHDGISGTIDEAANTAYTFSSNDPAFDSRNTSPSGAGCTLTPFDLLVRLSFNGDAKAAVKHLHQAVAA